MTNRTVNRAGRPRRRANVGVWAGALGLWLVPLIAMRFSDEVDWTVFDFVVWALMLGFAAGGFELATRISGSIAYRSGAALALGLSFLTVWANLAVGIIGDENNPLNLLFFGVLVIGAVASVSVLFRARGMIFAMIATAVAQVAVGVIAQIQDHNIWPFTIVAASLWLAASWLFRTAGPCERTPATV